jgi:hypothetical protein
MILPEIEFLYGMLWTAALFGVFTAVASGLTNYLKRRRQ